MKVNKLFTAILLGVAALGLGTGNAMAVCVELGGYALFQCADKAYIAPPPITPVFDANGRVTNVTTVFWQIGFGNAVLNTGNGTSGRGNLLSQFQGNDSGIFVPDVADARAITADPAIPAGALCLANNNFGNSGIDGCCDNERTDAQPVNNDDILNPYYDVYYSRNGYPGLYSLGWQQDYPVAVLSKTPGDSHFALMAVASVNRGNPGNGDNGPCADGTIIPIGSNDAVCDFRVGFYSFRDISNGNANAATGAPNVIPWQMAPRPKAACVAGCSGTATNRTINFQWDPVFWYHDGSIRPSTNPSIAPQDTTRAAGVGVLDVLRKTNTGNNWRGLARYDLQAAPVTSGNLDPNGRVDFSTLVWATVTGQADIVQPGPSATTGQATGPIVVNSLDVAPDTCFRVVSKVGKKPELAVTGVAGANTRLGKNGDIGYQIAPTVGSAITCIGGPLASEQATNVAAKRSKGSVEVTWQMTSELSVIGFDVYGENIKGQSTKLGSVACKECSSGAGASYVFDASLSMAKGIKTIRLEVNSATPQTVRVPVR